MTEIETIEGWKGTKGPYVIRTIRGYGFDQIVSTDEDLCICDVDMLGMPNRSLAEPGIYSGSRIGIEELHANARLLAKSYELALLAQELANTELFPTSDTKGSEAAARFTVLKRKARSLLSDITESKT